MTTRKTCDGEFRIVCAKCGVLPETAQDWVAASLVADEHADTCRETEWFTPAQYKFGTARSFQADHGNAHRVV